MQKTTIIIIFFFIFLLILTSAVSAQSPQNFTYMREITITERSGQNLTDYQVMIILNDTNFDFSHFLNNGNDILFTDSNGNTLPYWVEKMDIQNKSAIIWVRILHIPANQSVKIYMHYGNPNAQSLSSGKDTFLSFVENVSSTRVFNVTKLENPILTWNSSIDWMKGAVRLMHIVYNESSGKYLGYFTAFDNAIGSTGAGNYVASIGIAESKDGVNWTVIGKALEGVGVGKAFDGVSVFAGSVVYKDGMYHMWYEGRDFDDLGGYQTINGGNNPAIGYAYSYDGIHWIRGNYNPVIEGNKAWTVYSVPDGREVTINVGIPYAPAVIYNNRTGKWEMYFIAYNKDWKEQDFFRAESNYPDRNWTVTHLLMRPWAGSEICEGEVFLVDGIYWAFLPADAGVDGVWLLYSIDGIHWNRLVKIISPTQPTDDTWAKQTHFSTAINVDTKSRVFESGTYNVYLYYSGHNQDIYEDSGDWKIGLATMKISFTPLRWSANHTEGTVVRAKMKLSKDASWTAGYHGIGVKVNYKDDSNFAKCWISPYNGQFGVQKKESGTWGTEYYAGCISVEKGKWYVFECMCKNSAVYARACEWGKDLPDWTLIHDYGSGYYGLPESFDTIGDYLHLDAGNGVFEYLLVRKYVEPEPLVSISGETTTKGAIIRDIILSSHHVGVVSLKIDWISKEYNLSNLTFYIDLNNDGVWDKVLVGCNITDITFDRPDKYKITTKVEYPNGSYTFEKTIQIVSYHPLLNCTNIVNKSGFIVWADKAGVLTHVAITPINISKEDFIVVVSYENINASETGDILLNMTIAGLSGGDKIIVEELAPNAKNVDIYHNGHFYKTVPVKDGKVKVKLTTFSEYVFIVNNTTPTPPKEEEEEIEGILIFIGITIGLIAVIAGTIYLVKRAKAKMLTRMERQFMFFRRLK